MQFSNMQLAVFFLSLVQCVITAPQFQQSSRNATVGTTVQPLQRVQSPQSLYPPPVLTANLSSSLISESAETFSEELLDKVLSKSATEESLLDVLSSSSNDVCEPCPCVNNAMYCSALSLRSFEMKKPYLQITYLELSHNNLKELTGNVFEKLPNLVEVSLSNNYISTIDSEAFQGSNNLQRIDLSSNSVGEIPPLTLAKLSKLQRLYIMRNRLTDIEFIALINNCSLQIVQISTNALSRLPSKSFGLCFNLKELWIDGNKISEIHEDAFEGLVNLTTLDLSNNRLLSIQVGTFRSLTHLRTLDLSHNRLTTIEGKFFTTLIRLENLYLSFNWLSQIPPESFSSCVSLRHLDLSGNLLEIVDSSAFIITSTPTNNSLTKPRDNHSKCANFTSKSQNVPIEYLDLSRNHLRSIPVRSLLAFHNLEHLNLESNLITSFGPEFVCLVASLGDGLSFSGNRLVCTCESLFPAFRLAERIAPAFQPECLHTEEPWVVLRGRQCETSHKRPRPRFATNELAPPLPNSFPVDYSVEESPDSNVRATVLVSVLVVAFVAAMAAFMAEVVKYYRRGKFDVPQPEEIPMTQYARTTSMRVQEEPAGNREATVAVMVKEDNTEEMDDKNEVSKL